MMSCLDCSFCTSIASLIIFARDFHIDNTLSFFQSSVIATQINEEKTSPKNSILKDIVVTLHHG